MMPPHCGDVLLLVGAIVLGGFLSEDGATITAATLTVSSALDSRLAFVSAFVGLWIGDLGVYALARAVGPSLVQRSWFKKCFGGAARSSTDRKEKDGRLGLAISRFFPGTRVAAYVSAGLARMPAKVFTGITAVSALIWIVLVFAAIHLAPTQHVTAAKQRVGVVSLFGLGLFVLLRLWKKWGSVLRKRIGLVFARMVRWEFWPAWIFYAPVAMFCAWLGIRHRGLSLPATANPNQKNGGIIGESKILILHELMATSPESTAAGYCIAEGSVEERLAAIKSICEREGLEFPVVLKPDVAQRGAGFKKIQSLDQAEEYLLQVAAPLVLQRYVAGPREAGIFYYRFPQERTGHILGITRKQFPTVTGDGLRTVRELINADQRARLIARTYCERLGAKAERLPAAGESVRLVEAGNHCQGCIFEDGVDLYTEGLREAIDRISQKLPGFFIGRYDVRYESDESLRSGRGFMIIELNGAASEATNIYDARHSLWSAYRTLYRQWSLVYKIGAANRERGYQPATALAVFKDWVEFSRQAVRFPIAN
jgi:membrane protein DedA with SNARE-associated domain